MLDPSKNCLFAPTGQTATFEPTQNIFFITFSQFLEEINIFGLKTFQKVYIENVKGIYGDRRVKLDRIKSVKRFDLKRV